jgi:hypothetical protein
MFLATEGGCWRAQCQSDGRFTVQRESLDEETRCARRGRWYMVANGRSRGSLLLRCDRARGGVMAARFSGEVEFVVERCTPSTSVYSWI